MPTVKHGVGSITVWGYFAGHIIGDLIRVRGIMKRSNTEKFWRIMPFSFICNYVCFAWSRLSSECLREGIAKAFRLGIVQKYILDRCPEQIKDSRR